MNEKLGLVLAVFFFGLVSFSGQSQGTVPILCPSDDDRQVALAHLHAEIARAPTVDEARTLALAPMEAAQDALGTASIVVPFSQDVRKAQSRLDHMRSRIESAGTPAQVADEFSGLMWAGLDEDRLARVQVGSHGCDYSTGEVIAIVVGLILGIIPGLILLVVLC